MKKINNLEKVKTIGSKAILPVLLALGGLVAKAQTSDIVPRDSSYKKPSTQNSPVEFSRMRVSVSGGITLRLVQEFKSNEWFSAPSLPKTMTSPVINADISYSIKPTYAVGLKYFRIMDVYNQSGLKDATIVNFVAPVFYANVKMHTDKNRLAFGAAIGYYNYSRNIKANSGPIALKDNAAGALVEIAYDRKLARHLYIGLNTGVIGAELDAHKISDYDNPNIPEGAVERKFDFYASAGLRYVW